MSNRNRGPYKDASYQVSVHLAKRFQKRFFFKEIDQPEATAMVVNKSGQNKQSFNLY